MRSAGIPSRLLSTSNGSIGVYSSRSARCGLSSARQRRRSHRRSGSGANRTVAATGAVTIRDTSRPLQVVGSGRIRQPRRLRHERKVAATRCLPIEREGLRTPACMVAMSDEAVREVGRACFEFAQGAPGRFAVFDHELGRAQDLVEHRCDDGLVVAEGTVVPVGIEFKSSGVLAAGAIEEEDPCGAVSNRGVLPGGTPIRCVGIARWRSCGLGGGHDGTIPQHARRAVEVRRRGVRGRHALVIGSRARGRGNATTAAATRRIHGGTR